MVESVKPPVAQTSTKPQRSYKVRSLYYFLMVKWKSLGGYHALSWITSIYTHPWHLHISEIHCTSGTCIHPYPWHLYTVWSPTLFRVACLKLLSMYIGWNKLHKTEWFWARSNKELVIHVCSQLKTLVQPSIISEIIKYIGCDDMQLISTYTSLT